VADDQRPTGDSSRQPDNVTWLAMIVSQMLSQQLDSLNLAGTSKSQMMSRFVEVYKQMWVLNGDHISRIYAGTGALGSGRSKVFDVEPY